MNYVNIECIQSIKKLQHDTGQDLLKALTDVYFVQGPEALAKMTAALEKGDFETLKREAHSLKSSSGTLGIMRVFEICKSIEDETTLEEHPAKDHLTVLVRDLATVMNPSLEALRNIMQQNAA